MKERKILNILDELRTLAQLGLHYTTDSFDRERYERILTLSAGNMPTIIRCRKNRYWHVCIKILDT